MSQSPSPTSGPSPKSSTPDLKAPSISSQTVPEDVEVTERVSRPTLAFSGVGVPGASRDGRRSSVQFAPSMETPAREPRQKMPSFKLQRRMSSPPPPSTYQTRIGFDTFDNKNASDFSFTISSKHKDYNYTRRSRTFLCGNDENDYSEFALEWLIEELVEEGDEIVCLRVLSPDSNINSDASIQKGKYREEGRRLLKHLEAKNDDNKAINLILELALGKVEETIQRMIETYAPACLIVGTRGRSLGGVQALRSGSISKYCLQNSPVPVVVVRPEDKRKKKKSKRLADSRRQGYSSIMRQSNAGAGAGGALESQPSASEAGETEATAVAKAIGLNEGALGDWKGFDKKEGGDDGGEVIGTPLRKASASGPSREDAAYLTESPSPEGPLLAVNDDDTGDVSEMKLGSPLGNEAPGDEGRETGEIEAGMQGVGIEDNGQLQALYSSDVKGPESSKGKGKEREI
ncbi:hypothetical protein N7G274_000530 [Stereocaulon virgatum]|uniref:UspA domain-containing protein n=1 Tax=Stereocaulon virgatum TaxID=373712 RepID=A0ABR4AU02_9LECA